MEIDCGDSEEIERRLGGDWAWRLIVEIGRRLRGDWEEIGRGD